MIAKQRSQALAGTEIVKNSDPKPLKPLNGTYPPFIRPPIFPNENQSKGTHVKFLPAEGDLVDAELEVLVATLFLGQLRFQFGKFFLQLHVAARKAEKK